MNKDKLGPQSDPGCGEMFMYSKFSDSQVYEPSEGTKKTRNLRTQHSVPTYERTYSSLLPSPYTSLLSVSSSPLRTIYIILLILSSSFSFPALPCHNIPFTQCIYLRVCSSLFVLPHPLLLFVCLPCTLLFLSASPSSFLSLIIFTSHIVPATSFLLSSHPPVFSFFIILSCSVCLYVS